MNIVFMGTPEFAVTSLDLLIRNGFNVVAVITAPDKPAGRGQFMHESAIKKFAVQNQLKVLQPNNLKDPEFLSTLKGLNADLQIVVAFRMLPEIVWNMPPQGTYNLHASLLPKYRGAAPINWSIINGEKETGVTTFKLKHEIDTGQILLQERVAITETMNAGELHDLLKTKGAELLLNTVQLIKLHLDTGKILPFINQNDIMSSHAPKLNKVNCKIDWNEPVEKIYNLVRGLSPAPAAYTFLTDSDGTKKLVKIYNARYILSEHGNTNGTLNDESGFGLKVYARGGWIEILEIQMEGKKRMMVSEFLKGYKLKRVNTSFSLGTAMR